MSDSQTIRVDACEYSPQNRRQIGAGLGEVNAFVQIDRYWQ